MVLCITCATQPVAAMVSVEIHNGIEYYPDAPEQRTAGRSDVHFDWRGDVLNARTRIGARAEIADSPWGQQTTTELREAYLAWQIGHSTLRLGRQQIAWGRADAFRLLDKVNPLRYPDALFVDVADARIPLWMADWEGQENAWQWQVFAGPDRHLNAVDPRFPLLQPVSPDTLRTPEGDTHHGFSGARIGRQIGELDIGLYWLDGWNHEPLWHPLVNGGFEAGAARRRVWGVSADQPVGPGVVRAELVHNETATLDTHFVRVSQRMDQALLGYDLEHGPFFISPQFYWEEADLGSYTDENRFRSYSSLLTQYKFAQDRGRLRAFWWHQAGGDENWWSIKLSYEWDEHLELRMGADSFQVSDDSALTAFRDLSRVTLEAVWRF